MFNPSIYHPHRKTLEMEHPFFEVRHYRDTAPLSMPEHYHNYYEIILLLSGDIDFVLDTYPYHLDVGDLLIAPAGHTHQCEVNAARRPCEYIIINISKTYLEYLHNIHHLNIATLAEIFPNDRNSYRLRPLPAQMDHLLNLLDTFLHEEEDCAYGAATVMSACIASFLIHVSRIKQAAPLTAQSSGFSIQTVQQYIDSNYSEPITLDYLSARFFMDKYHLLHEFKRATGQSIHQYIIQRRLEAAKRLMDEGGNPTAVYPQCGFGDYSNFYRNFVKQYGVSPSTYAENHK